MTKQFLQRNWYFFTPALIILIPVLMILFCSVKYQYGLPEAARAVLNFGSTGTRRSIGFSERNFRLVREGMDVKSVFAIIANPMERLDNDTRWRYSLPASGASFYHERTLIFERDKNGVLRVKERISRFSTP